MSLTFLFFKNARFAKRAVHYLLNPFAQAALYSGGSVRGDDFSFGGFVNGLHHGRLGSSRVRGFERLFQSLLDFGVQLGFSPALAQIFGGTL
ncbi:MAG: hypothetical protein WDZ67_02020 [Patescibacteria group bacterium]